MRGLRFSHHNTGTANASSRSEYLVSASPAAVISSKLVPMRHTTECDPSFVLDLTRYLELEEIIFQVPIDQVLQLVLSALRGITRSVICGKW